VQKSRADFNRKPWADLGFNFRDCYCRATDFHSLNHRQVLNTFNSSLIGVLCPLQLRRNHDLTLKVGMYYASWYFCRLFSGALSAPMIDQDPSGSKVACVKSNWRRL